MLAAGAALPPTGSDWKFGSLPPGIPHCFSLVLSLPTGLLGGAQTLSSWGTESLGCLKLPLCCVDSGQDAGTGTRARWGQVDVAVTGWDLGPWM